MNKVYFRPETDGFYGVYYPNEEATSKAMIVMLGDSSDDRMAVSIDRRITASIKEW